MARRVLITGLGPVSAMGLGIEATWQSARTGRSGIAPITAFDPAGFACRIAGEVRDFKVSNFVPKSYRKGIKVMARDIELAVAAADLAARDAKLVTRGIAEGDPASPALSYDPTRVGAHIGAGLIAAELNELTDALNSARAANGEFDIHAWGKEGMTHLTPLWLLKYLPNMLACHVTIIHDTQGPSNTITCGEASSGLSIGESLRVIQRNAADACFCGGAESKLNPMAYLRQLMTGRLTTTENEAPTTAIRPFSKSANGTALGEGGGIVVLEAEDTFNKRRDASGARAYAAIRGFGASQTVHPQSRNLKPDPQGKGITLAIKAAMREAGIGADEIDLVIPFGLGWAESDRAEAAAIREVLGDYATKVPIVSMKPYAGNCGAGSGGIDVTIAAKALVEQTIPATLNCDNPLDGIHAGTAPSRSATLRHVLTFGASLGGQNAALILERVNTSA